MSDTERCIKGIYVASQEEKCLPEEKILQTNGFNKVECLHQVRKFCGIKPHKA